MNVLTKTWFLRIAPKHDTVQNNASQRVFSSYQSSEFHVRHLRQELWKSMAKPQPTYVCIAVESALWPRKQVPEAMASHSFKTFVHTVVFIQWLQTHCEYYCLLILASKTMWTHAFLHRQNQIQCEYCYFCTRSLESFENTLCWTSCFKFIKNNNIVFAPTGSKSL